MFMGFIMHFYIIFGTNLLTQSPVPVSFFPSFSVSQKTNIKRSPNGMKTSGELFLERKIQKTWSIRKGSNEEGARQGARPPPWARPPP